MEAVVSEQPSFSQQLHFLGEWAAKLYMCLLSRRAARVAASRETLGRWIGAKSLTTVQEALDELEGFGLLQIMRTTEHGRVTGIAVTIQRPQPYLPRAAFDAKHRKLQERQEKLRDRIRHHLKEIESLEQEIALLTQALAPDERHNKLHEAVREIRGDESVGESIQVGSQVDVEIDGQAVRMTIVESSKANRKRGEANWNGVKSPTAEIVSSQAPAAQALLRGTGEGETRRYRVDGVEHAITVLRILNGQRPADQ